MDKTISATEARIRFGELLQNAQIGPVVVERSGRPIAVVLSIGEYERLSSGQTRTDWRSLLAETHERVRVDLKGRSLPDPALVLRQIREERDENYDLH